LTKRGKKFNVGMEREKEERNDLRRGKSSFLVKKTGYECSKP